VTSASEVTNNKSINQDLVNYQYQLSVGFTSAL